MSFFWRAQRAAQVAACALKPRAHNTPPEQRKDALALCLSFPIPRFLLFTLSPKPLKHEEGLQAADCPCIAFAPSDRSN
jgi:hypothetical protein